MKAYEIRPMREEDINPALDLWSKAFRAGFSSGFDTHESIRRYLKRNPDLSTVALKGQELVGALMCGHDGRRGSIYHTAVDPSHRKKGLGQAMTDRSLDALRSIGITSGFLFIHTSNPGSEAFWRQTGWQVIDQVKYLYKEF